MLTGRKYLLALTPEQEAYAEQVAGICRAVWNTALEQRREYARRRSYIGWAQQDLQLTEAKVTEPWLRDAPSPCLQQVIRDLDRACRRHGTFKVHWRSSRRWAPSFRFPSAKKITVRRINRRWGEVRLLRFGWLRFHWSRSLGGQIRNATVRREGGKWYVSFMVEDGLVATEPNGKPPVGVDRGVVVAVATSDGWMRDRNFASPGEMERLRRLQRRLNRCKRNSNRRKAVRGEMARLHARVRLRRRDFCAWTANRLTMRHGCVVLEDLDVRKMTVAAKGTRAEPGRNVRQKAGLNRVIMNKGWGLLASTLAFKARYNGSEVIKIAPHFTSQRCSACGTVDAKSRESQARFACTSCGHAENADVNAAKNILAAGLAVTGRGDLGVAQSAKRQPLVAA